MFIVLTLSKYGGTVRINTDHIVSMSYIRKFDSTVVNTVDGRAHWVSDSIESIDQMVSLR